MLRTPPPTSLGSYYLAVTNEPVLSLRPLLKQAAYKAVGTGGWLQLHVATSTTSTRIPANGTAPIFAPTFIEADSQGVVSFTEEGLMVNSPGLVLVISSTQATLTAATGVTVDLSALIEEWEDQDPAASTAGDLTSTVSALQVWTEAEGLATPKRLQKIKVTNVDASVNYVCVYAVDTPAASSTLQFPPYKLTASQSATLSFGQGLRPYQEDSDATTYKGCNIRIQSVATASATADGNAKILAYYKV